MPGASASNWTSERCPDGGKPTVRKDHVSEARQTARTLVTLWTWPPMTTASAVGVVDASRGNFEGIDAFDPVVSVIYSIYCSVEP